jgi:hypothetical protein
MELREAMREIESAITGKRICYGECCQGKIDRAWEEIKKYLPISRKNNEKSK